MGSTLALAKTAWRASSIDGVPASGPNDPDKSEIIKAFQDADARLSSCETRLAAIEAGTTAAPRYAFSKFVTLSTASARVLPFDAARSALTFVNNSDVASIWINDVGGDPAAGYRLLPRQQVEYAPGEVGPAPATALSDTAGSVLQIRVSNSSGLDPWIDDFIAALPNPVAPARQTIIAQLRGSLMTAGVLDMLDMLHVGMLFGDAANALVDWASPARSGTLGGATVPTFTADRGFVGSGAGWIDTGAALPSVNYGVNAACMFALLDGVTAKGSTEQAMGYGAGAVQGVRTGTVVGYRANTTTTSLDTVTPDRFIGWVRRGASAATLYVGSAQSAVAAPAAASVVSRNLTLLALNGGSGPTGPSTAAIRFACAGGPLSDSQVNIMRTAVLAAATAVGA